MTTPPGTAAAARQFAAGYALRAPPSANCRALKDLHHFLGHQRAARDAGLIRIHGSAKPELWIEFSSPDAIDLHLPALGITLKGHPVESA